jgi:lysophospholipase L1-like esterase
VFQAAYTGLTTPVAGVSRGIIPVATFTQNYDRLMTQLTAGAPGIKGALVSVLQTTQTPILFPAAALSNAQFMGSLTQVAGGPITVLPNCTGSNSLVSLFIALEMRAARHPRTISCDDTPDPSYPLLGNIWIVDPAEQTELNDAVVAYNAYLQTKAAASDFAYVDLNPGIGPLKASGAISTVPNLGSPTPFGTHFTLDGLHPGTALHVLFANAIITAINAKYGTSLTGVP